MPIRARKSAKSVECVTSPPTSSATFRMISRRIISSRVLTAIPVM
jgi:hypothetical protein